MSDRTYEIVLWGATGFTGELVAEYLAEHGPDDLRWAIAGRNQAKLEGVRAELAQRFPGCAELPILTGDSTDRASLDAIAKKTDVVCTTVGPYAKYGSDLVAACVEAGTHYCDLTGEVQWIRRMIDQHHAAAEDRRVRIVHCCGFDSIPSDLGVLTVQEAAQELHGAPCDEIRMHVVRTKGGFSGGTAASMIAMFDEIEADPSVRKVMGHPYALNPEGERKGPDGSDPKGITRDREVPCYLAPFVMGTINTRIVRRSNALRDYPYGRGFRYQEWQRFPSSPKGLAMATGLTAGLGGFVVAAAIPPVRRWLHSNVLPSPGEGPSRAEREAGYFHIAFIGTGRGEDGASFRVDGEVRGVNDPGYGETAKMLSHAALCLARDELSTPGGVVTPATAMGMRLVERLRTAGMTFTAG